MSNGGIEQLTGREKRVLRLLAGGHSVKTAAAEEANTENAASELLRSARRKLGTGSSREAARLFAARDGDPPKNRDEKSVLPRSPANAPSVPRFDKGTIAMIITALTAATALILALQGGNSGNRAPAGAAKVVRTTPANGATLAPGPFTVSVTFDRPMAPQSYSFVRSDEGLYPDCVGQPRLSTDRRTYSLECTASRPGTYVMHFNRPPYIGFVDAATKTPAREARLEFTVRRR